MIRPFLAAVLLATACGASADPGPSPELAARPAAVRPLPLNQVRLADHFWAPKLKRYTERSIPHAWPYVAGELRALRRAAGQPVSGDLNGTWGEANLYKLMETVAHSLSQFPDPALERRADEIIALVAAAQQPDGYVHAYITNNRKPPWDPAFLDGSHDGYVLGHMIEAAIEYEAATGKRAFLDIACKAADQAHAHFLGPPAHPGFDGHAELEMALVELYRVVPNPRYLALARAFVEWRGRHCVAPASETPRAYFQDHLPLRQQTTLEGHAVRAIFFATGVADLARETGEADYRLAANRFWECVSGRRMNLAGGIGPRREHEALGEDYELPDTGYYESCAACGLADFAHRMFLLERRAGAADVLERVLYNTVLHGISLGGTNSYYQNPLSDRDNPRYNSWVCCPPNLTRTLLQVGRYAYAAADRDLYVNFYFAGRCVAVLDNASVAVTVQTDYPWDGTVKLEVQPNREAAFALNLRLPAWCREATLRLNGQPFTQAPPSGLDRDAAPAGASKASVSAPAPRRANDDGYLRIDRRWRAGDTVELTLSMPVQRLEAHPNLREAAGKVALQRGPIVYAFEALDNHGSARVELGADPQFRVEHRPDFLDGVSVIHGVAADGRPFLAIPFYALANRGKSAQEVWAVQRGAPPGSSWWLGQLYRPYER